MIPDEIRRMKPLTGNERLGANRDSEYLGAEDIDPGTEPILTIAAIYNGMVTLQRGKENKDVIVFKEESVSGIRNVRPLIVNATNRKTLRKLFKSVTADNLTGKRIQLYIDHNVRDPSSGDKIDGIRIKSKIPTAVKNGPIICEDCGKPVQAVGGYSAEDVARINQNRYGKTLCAECSKKRGEEDSAVREGENEEMLNHVTIIGRITHDLELKTTQSGVSYITFSVACDDDYKPKDGGERAVDFIRVKAWRHTAEFVNSYFAKGRSIIVSGRLKADNYTDKDGNKRTDTYVLAESVYFADSKKSDENGGGANAYPAASVQADPAADFATLESDDANLPF